MPFDAANPPGSASHQFWWQATSLRRIAPHDYPAARIRQARKKAEERSKDMELRVKEILQRSRSPEAAVRGIARWVQDALMHPPLLQPSEARWNYWRWRQLGLLPAPVAGHEEVRTLLHQRLVMDPGLLLELGEARCGQCAAVLCAALQCAGFQAQPWQLPHHIAVEVTLDGESCIVDADAFKTGVFLEENGRLVSRRTLEANPYLVDRFKPTGWMFRRDSAYAREPKSGRTYRGYIDFYSPEEDGQISARYAAARVLRPPGVPQWLQTGPLQVGRDQDLELAFAATYPERAAGYRVRCGRQSRGYRYDHLVLDRLHQETSADVFEWERQVPQVKVRLAEPGRYFLTAAAIPAYLEEFPSYVWWSDELIIDVV